ncbi:MAG TPA: hypothetical protein VMW18_05880 [Candidatus Binatia bacterium]|nr:hypothetical protein [Candidatus Binatia bacterium]
MQITQKIIRRQILAAAALAAVAFMPAVPALAATTIHVSLTDQGAEKEMPMGLGMNMGGDMTKATMAVVVDKKEVKAGKVTFEVVNDSKGLVHELIVGHLVDPAKQLPYVPADSKVDEEGSDHLGEVSELDPGKSGALILTLKPGTYILYCNVAGHYMAGMWTLITVK